MNQQIKHQNISKMNLFDPEFYPTPESVIQYMVGNIDLSGKRVLEPSAGTGNIVDYCKNLGAEVFTCEKHPQLAQIVASKSRFIKNDFLQVTADEVSHIHYIFMNPPFSCADQHISHAINIAPDGCEIIALMNQNTYNNDFSRSRQILKQQIKDYGYTKNLGNVFSKAENRTDVDVALVHIFKPIKQTNSSKYFSDLESEDDDYQPEYNGIMPYNVIRDAVQRYVNACELYDRVADDAVLMNNLISVFGGEKCTFTLTQDGKEQSVQTFKLNLQKNAWNWIFLKLDMNRYLTESVKKDINEYVENNSKRPFTMKNIYRLIETIVATNGDRMGKVLVEVFDKLTMHYKENRYHVEGWATNSHYMVNQKFILEYVATIDYGGHASVRWSDSNSNTQKLNDLVKALCYMTGQKYKNEFELYNFFRAEPIMITDPDNPSRQIQKLDDKFEKMYHPRKTFGVWYDWTFFEIKLFKKGTIHVKFKDKKVWENFNRQVAKLKGYPLPDSVKL